MKKREENENCREITLATSSADLNLKKSELRSLRPIRNPEHSDSSSARNIQASNSVEEAIE